MIDPDDQPPVAPTAETYIKGLIGIARGHIERQHAEDLAVLYKLEGDLWCAFRDGAAPERINFIAAHFRDQLDRDHA